jgi:hypothetical protein
MLEANAVADAIEQQNRRNRPHELAPFGPTNRLRHRDSLGFSSALR